MATVIMNMSDYTHEVDDTGTYGDEVLYSGWNPALGLVQQQAVTSGHAAMPADLAAMDVEQFVRRMYVYLSYE